MTPNYPVFISALEKSDPKFFAEMKAVFDLAMAPGELDARTKVLLAMSLDALSGAEGGVKVLAKAARSMGVTEAQIAEALRLAYFVAGNKVLETSRAAFEEYYTQE